MVGFWWNILVVKPTGLSWSCLVFTHVCILESRNLKITGHIYPRSVSEVFRVTPFGIKSIIHFWGQGLVVRFWSDPIKSLCCHNDATSSHNLPISWLNLLLNQHLFWSPYLCFLRHPSGVLGCQTQTALQVHNLAIPYVKGGIGMRICHGVKVLRSIYVSGSVGQVLMFLFPM